MDLRSSIEPWGEAGSLKTKTALLIEYYGASWLKRVNSFKYSWLLGIKLGAT